MDEAVSVRCPGCGDLQDVPIGGEGGAVRDLEQPCESCGRPLEIRVVFDEWGDPEATVAG